MQKFDTPAPITAVLDIPAGRIRFIAADRADTTVEVLPVNASKGRDVKAAEQATVGYVAGVLRIEAPAAKHQYFGPSGSIEVTVELPAGSRVEAKASCAEFRGVGRLGDVACEAFGAVNIDEAASVHVAAYVGDITVGRLTGPAEISTVSASLDAGTRYGRIHNALKNTEGAAAGLNIHATTDMGDIVARSL